MIMHGTFTNVEEKNSGNLVGEKISQTMLYKVCVAWRQKNLLLGQAALPSVSYGFLPHQVEKVEGKEKLSLHSLSSDSTGKTSFTTWSTILNRWMAPFS